MYILKTTIPEFSLSVWGRPQGIRFSVSGNVAEIRLLSLWFTALHVHLVARLNHLIIVMYRAFFFCFRWWACILKILSNSHCQNLRMGLNLEWRNGRFHLSPVRPNQILSTSTGSFERDGRELKEGGTPEDRIRCLPSRTLHKLCYWRDLCFIGSAVKMLITAIFGGSFIQRHFFTKFNAWLAKWLQKRKPKSFEGKSVTVPLGPPHIQHGI
jgi:hypothetical protein